MSHTLLAILGTLVVNGNLRQSMVAWNRNSRVAALQAHGFFVSEAELDVVDRLMASFASGALDDACETFAVECPDWPCSHFSIATADSGSGV